MSQRLEPVNKHASHTRLANAERSIGVRWIACFGLILVVSFAITCGLIGRDFGYHWDEQVTIRSIPAAIETGVLLPSFYLYPGVNFLVAMAVYAPTAAKAIITGSAPDSTQYAEIHPPPPALDGKPATGSRMDMLQHGLKSYAWSKIFLLRVRTVYVVLSLLAALWIFVAAATQRRSWWEALLAASLMSLSWEFGYHARWVTPDALTTSFATLSLMFVLIALEHNRPRPWLTFGAISAGLAAGTKYQGVIALVPVLVIAFKFWKDSPHGQRYWREAVRLTAISAATYLCTTPGTLLDPIRFIQSFVFQLKTYQAGWKEHTVNRGFDHLVKLLEFYGFSAFSHYAVIAVCIFLLALLGAVVIFRENRWRAFLLLFIPVFYTLYMAMQRVMFVRNYLVVLPFLAILAARGVGFLAQHLAGRRVAAVALTLTLVAALTLNAVWLWRAAQTIPVREFARYRYIEQLSAYLSDHASTRFALSPKVHSETLHMNGLMSPNAVTRLDSARYAIFYASEVPDPAKWDATKFNYTKTWFGPYELNFNYYPTWEGEDRIVVLNVPAAARLNVFSSPDRTP